MNIQHQTVLQKYIILIIFCYAFNLHAATNSNTNISNKPKGDYSIHVKKWPLSSRTKYQNGDSISLAISEKNIFMTRACMLYAMSKKGQILTTHNFCQMNKNFLYVGNIDINEKLLFTSVGTKEIYAIDANTFKLKWSKYLSNYIRGTIATDNKNLYFGTVDNKLYTLEQQDGSILWSQYISKNTLGNLPPSKPLLHNNTVLFNYSPGYIAAISKSGDLLWNKSLNFFYNVKGTSAFIINDSLFTIDKGLLVEFLIETGERQWTSRNNKPIDAVVTNNKSIILITKNDKITSLDSKEKKVKWSVENKTSKIQDLAIIEENFLLILNNKNQLLLFDLNNGKQITRRKAPRGLNKSNIAIYKDRAYIYTSLRNTLYEISILN